MAWSAPASLLAFMINGDALGLTFYTRKDMRKVAFPSAPPKKPYSPKQLTCQARFKAAAHSWSQLTGDQQAAYNQVCNKLSLCAWGMNLWLSCCMAPNDRFFRTIVAQSDVDLAAPIHV